MLVYHSKEFLHFGLAQVLDSIRKPFASLIVFIYN